MLDMKVEISGKSFSDLVSALEEVLRLVEAENLSGLNSNDTGKFHFDITGEDEDDETIKYRNHYRCDHEGRAEAGQEPAEWSDEWSCTCNDKCPVCNAEIEPYESEDI